MGGKSFDVDRLFRWMIDVDPSQREKELRVSGIPDALAKEVLALLAADDLARREGWLDVPKEETFRGGGDSTQGDDVDFLQPGQVVGEFRVERLLGRGGFAAVYEAFDVQLKRKVALKYPCHVEEGASLASLAHENLVTVYSCGVGPKGLPFIAMEYIDGITIDRYVQLKQLSPTEIALLLRQVALAVHYLSQRCIIHRDIKPSNVLVDKSGEPKLVDFGLAVDESRRRVNAAGTCSYMSPEQVRYDDLDTRCDIWGLGAVLYELLAGVKPFRGASVQEVFDAIRYDDPKPIQQINRNVPVSLANICLRCLRKEPSDRFSQADELSRCLEGVAGRGSRRLWVTAAITTGIFGATAVWGGQAKRASGPAVPANILEREPKPVVWFPHSEFDSYGWHANRFLVNGKNESIFSFGEQHWESYSLDLIFGVEDWDGRAGVLLSVETDVVAGKKQRTCTTVSFGAFEHRYGNVRVAKHFAAFSSPTWRVNHTKNCNRWDVADPTEKTEQLTVVVEDRRLVRVVFRGRTYEVDVPVKGPVGVFASRGTVAFHSLTIGIR